MGTENEGDTADELKSNSSPQVRRWASELTSLAVPSARRPLPPAARVLQVDGRGHRRRHDVVGALGRGRRGPSASAVVRQVVVIAAIVEALRAAAAVAHQSGLT